MLKSAALPPNSNIEQETARSTPSYYTYRCHTKVTLKILTLRRALQQAEKYEISQI